MLVVATYAILIHGIVYFLYFPASIRYRGLGASGYKMTLYDYECFHSSLWGNVADMLNVIVLSTSVCGNRVYCVDVLH